MCVWICRDIQLTKRMQSITGFLTSKTKSLLVWRALFGFDGERKKKALRCKMCRCRALCCCGRCGSERQRFVKQVSPVTVAECVFDVSSPLCAPPVPTNGFNAIEQAHRNVERWVGALNRLVLVHPKKGV